MQLFLVTKTQYAEGADGDLEAMPNEVIGIYSSKKIAEEKAKSTELNEVHGQFRSETEEYEITELTLDK